MPKQASLKLTHRLDECTCVKDNPAFALNDAGTNNRVTVEASGKKCQAIKVDM